MDTCHNLKKGNIIVCQKCRLELEVVEECKGHTEGETCNCEETAFICCGEPMVRKDRLRDYRFLSSHT